MDVILGLVGLLVLGVVSAVVRHDAPLWVIALARALVRLSTRLQPPAEREVAGSVAEFESLATEVQQGTRTLTSVARFSGSLLVGQAVRAVTARPPLHVLADAVMLVVVVGASVYVGLLTFILLASTVGEVVVEGLVTAGLGLDTARWIAFGIVAIGGAVITGLLVSRYGRFRRWLWR